MPPSGAKPGAKPGAAPDSAPARPIDGRGLAIAAEALFLANLMLAPGIAFIALAVLWKLFNRESAPALARAHLRQTFWVSLVGGALLVGVCCVLVVTLGIHSPWMWTFAVLYFTCVHSTLILLGVVGLSKALNGKPWRYPLIGPR